jgi:hypothetical protein
MDGPPWSSVNNSGTKRRLGSLLGPGVPVVMSLRDGF